MATNPYVNKVQYGNDTLIDLTNDTATEQTVLEGYTFHGADGRIRTGTAVAGGGDDKMDIDGTNADTSVTFPDSAFTIGSRASSFDMGLVETYVDNVSTLPYTLSTGTAVVYNNKIHIFPVNGDIHHYSWDGTSWVEESATPYSSLNWAAVVYDNKIHILGGSSAKTNHYSWDGTSWVEESTLPYSFYRGSAVVYNNKIHILGTYQGGGLRYHYSWDGTSWVEESTLPCSYAYDFSAVVYNDKIHILGCTYSSYYYIKHYSWDGTSWVEESDTPYAFSQGSAVVYDNKIHILGTNEGSSYDKQNHYSWNGSRWFKNSRLPFVVYDRPAVVYGDKIHILGNYSTKTDHMSYESYHDIIEVSEPEKKGTFVQGDQSTAPGDYSYARGYNCLSEGNYSKAEGINALALYDFQFVSKGSSNKFGAEEFAYARSLYNNVINSSLTYQTAIDGRYGCSGTVNITTSTITTYIKIDPQGVYLLIIAANNGGEVAGNNTIQLISYYKITQLVSSGPFVAQFYTSSGYKLYDIIYFTNSVSSSSRSKLQFTLIRLI